ncbi:hypothetical protein CR513_41705, partial [Mucuna pruriens]
MVTMFIDTLPSPYYDKVVGNVAFNFVDLVVVGERIELGIQHGKFAYIGFAKKPTPEKKKGKTNVVLGRKSSPICNLDPFERIKASNDLHEPTANALRASIPAANKCRSDNQL